MGLPERNTLLTAASALDTTSPVIPLQNRRRIGPQVEWGAGVNAGAVDYEIAPTPNYSGTWQNLVTITYPATDAGGIDVAGGFIRARVSTDLVGGTANAHINLS